MSTVLITLESAETARSQRPLMDHCEKSCSKTTGRENCDDMSELVARRTEYEATKWKAGKRTVQSTSDSLADAKSPDRLSRSSRRGQVSTIRRKRGQLFPLNVGLLKSKDGKLEVRYEIGEDDTISLPTLGSI